MAKYNISKTKSGLYVAACALGLGGILSCDNPIEPEPNKNPVAEPSASPMQGYSPLPVDFDGRASYDSDGTIVKYVWSFGDGHADSTSGAMASHMYETVGSYTSGLTVVDNSGGRGSKTLEDIKATQPPVNNPAQITQFNVSPPSGVSPLPVRVQYKCEDKDGPDDIARSDLIVGSDTIPTTSIDTTFTFTQTTPVGAICEDKLGEGEMRGVEVEVSQPPQKSISQTADLTNYVDITLTLNATNVPEVTRETYHNGNLTETRTFTTFPDSGTLTDRLIGNWRFIAKAPGVTPDTTEVVAVLDYDSEAPDFSGVNMDGNERDSTEVHLPRATDRNKGQLPVKYTGVTATGGVEASLGEFPNDTILKLKFPEIAGPDPVPYSAQLTREGSSDVITLEGRVLDVAGPMWVRNIDFGSRQEGARAIGITPSGQIVVGGGKVSGGMLYGILGGLDSNGNVKWSRELGQGTSITDIISSNTNSFFVTGYHRSPVQSTLCGEIDGEGTFITDPVLNKFPGDGGSVIQYFNNRIYIGEFNGDMAIAESDCSFVDRMTLRENSRIFGLSVGQDYILASGDFIDAEGSWNVAGFVRKLDKEGTLLWERIYDDHIQLYLVEQEGMVYVGGLQLDISNNPRLMFVSKLDYETGNEQWKVSWDGDIENPYYTQGHFTEGLISNPAGGVVLIPQLAELPGSNPHCPIGDQNCWDFGAWAVSPTGSTLWTIREDFNDSYWDISTDAVFDGEGNLIIAGRSIPNPETNNDTDLTVAKFRVR